MPASLVTADGVRRSFQVRLPDDYDPERPSPVVFDFHGLGSDGVQQTLVTSSPAVAARRGYVSVVPDGAVNELLGARLWALTTSESRPAALDGQGDGALLVDDVAFTGELLDLIESDFCVDTGRVFAMGLSNGGFFSSVLACEMADRIAAVASVAGMTHPDGCEPVRPVPVLAFHGTADEVVPFEGGGSSLLEGGGALPGLDSGVVDGLADELFQPIEGEVAEWAESAGCAVDPTLTPLSATVERRTFGSCDAGGAVEFYVVEGGGHTWPGSVVMSFLTMLGPTTFDIDATALAFDWFDAHPMPGA